LISLLSVAAKRRTGIFTNPKLKEPFHIALIDKKTPSTLLFPAEGNYTLKV
jgi:hypothetical protein